MTPLEAGMGFNSKKVQLKDSATNVAGGCKLCFNSKKVQLKVLEIFRHGWRFQSFNSKKVQLKALLPNWKSGRQQVSIPKRSN